MLIANGLRIFCRAATDFHLSGRALRDRLIMAINLMGVSD